MNLIFVDPVLWGMIVGIAIASLIGAVVYWVTIHLYIAFVGGPISPNAVPKPTYVKSYSIVAIAAYLNLAIVFGLAYLIALIAPNEKIDPRMLPIYVTLISMLVGVMVLTLASSFMLPTTFVRGLLVSLGFFLVATCIGSVLAGVFYIVAFLIG